MATTLAPARTALADLDRTANRLKEAAPRFAALTISQRIELLDGMTAGYAGIAVEAVRAACEAKRIPGESPIEGEEWSLGPVITLHNMRLLRASLRAVTRSGTTRVGPVGQTIDGRTRVGVFPATPLDRVVFSRVTAQVHLRSGARAEDRARFYREPDRAGAVVLVLGAGNVNAITPLDVTTRMFNDGKVCLVKMNPVNAYLGPLLETAFRDAIARDFLAITYGDAEEGAYLAAHPAIDEIHLTGSDRTHDALVWGEPGPDREARKAAGTPRLTKPVTSELGNISPVIVVPGPYTPRQLAWQAENIAGGVTNNASFNCNAHKLLITGGRSSDESPIVAGIERQLQAVAPRFAYYPGAADRYHALTAEREGLRRFGAGTPGTLPWTLIRDLDTSRVDDPAFTTEPFCAVLSQTSIDADDPLEFLDRAVRLVNTQLWGTLVASIVIHPSMRRDPVLGEAVDRAIASLRYGTVGVNIWGAYGFALGAPWGGHPSSSLADIQSGLGFVHNTAMLEGVEKTVLEQPIINFPKPIHFPSHRTARTLGRSLAAVEASGRYRGLAPVLSAALRA